MKKITLSLLTILLTNSLFSQTFSTGTIQFFPEYSVKIDVTTTQVTLTQIMPSDRWYALAFNNNGMDSGDIVAFINTTNISDRQLGGFAVPVADAVQSWTTISNTVTGNVRTVVSTRALNTGEPDDYVFSATAGSINLACARASSASFTLAPHGGSANAVSTAAYSVTLDNATFKFNDFKMYPNPSQGLTVIELPNNIETGVVKMYDVLGRVVKNQTITATENQITTSDLKTGNYLVVLRTDYGNVTKNLIVE
ncbi:T9SS type A sorting domain-containing protein [Flavobacterium sp. j3]|uniref:T9SS type A sorting domain-containing protein n=1 Tax=Flavobacterium aureirubrum TaxID=3133147 RepID=A0ABU9N4E3_9FLAO